MSINSVSVDTTSTNISINPSLDLVSTSSQKVDIQNTEGTVTGHKKEYAIVGDSIYASVSQDEAPTWLTGLIDNVVTSSIAAGMTDYDLLVQDVLTAINSIDVAANSYVEQINITSIVDGIVASHLTTLNASVGATYATKVELSSVIATTETAIAIDISSLDVSLNNEITSQITNIQTAIAAADASLASDVTALTSAFASQNEEVSGNASAVQGLQTYVGLAHNGGLPDGTGVLSRLSIIERQTDGVILTLTGTYDVMSGTGPTLDIVNEALPYATWLAAESTIVGEEEWVRASHVGDVYIKYSVDANYNKVYLAAYKFIKTSVDDSSPYSTDSYGYTWAAVTDTDTQNAYMVALQAYDLADNKRRVFTETPFGPYNVGDLWTEGSSGDLKRCKTENLVIGSYNVEHWELASKYTDDSVVIALSTGLADGTVAINLDLATIDGTVNLSTYLADEVDSLVVVFSGTDHTEFDLDDPSTVKINDLYIETTTDTTGAVTIDVTNVWKCTNVTTELVTWEQINSNTNLVALADLTDGKRTIYGGETLPTASTANPFRDNDLFIPTLTFTDVIEYVENEIYRYSGDTWIKATRYDSIVSNLAGQIDGKVELYFGGNVPPFSDKVSSVSDAKGGDYWYCDTDGAYAQGNIYSYVETANSALFDYTWTLSSDISRSAFDLADGKRTVYSNAATDVPNTADENIQLSDLWIPSSTDVTYSSGKVYKCTNISTPVWEEVDYTNDAVVEGIQDGSIPLDPEIITVDSESTSLQDYVVAEADKRVHVYSNDTAPTDGNPTGVENNDIYLWNTTAVKVVAGSNVTYDIIYTYKYNATAGAGLKWENITTNSNISNLSDLADGKRTIYANQSDDVPAGEINDLWIPTTSGTAPAGVTADALYIPGEVYQYTTSWVLATKYTENLDGFVSVINPKIDTIKNQIDGEIVYYFSDSALPSTETAALNTIKSAYTTEPLREAANGNIAYFKDTKNGYWYGSTVNSWSLINDSSVLQALQVAEDAQGTADGKVSQFYAWGHPTIAPYDIVESAVTVALASSFRYWFKADGELYYKVSSTWTINPNVAEGDIVEVFDPLTLDSTMHSYNGTSWQQAGPTGIISKSSSITSLENDVTGENGHVAGAISNLKQENEAYADSEGARVENKFAYESTVNLNGAFYSSGFGLTTTGVTQPPGADGTQGNAFSSNFWINAGSLKFTNDNSTGSASPFTIDATGTTPQVSFNGVVNFSNVSGSTKPDANATNGMSSTERSQIFHSTDTTKIDGGNIKTGTVTADEIAAGSITASSLRIIGVDPILPESINAVEIGLSAADVNNQSISSGVTVIDGGAIRADELDIGDMNLSGVLDIALGGGNNGALSWGKTGGNDFSTQGMFFGVEAGDLKFNLGSPSSYIYFDGTTVQLVGTNSVAAVPNPITQYQSVGTHIIPMTSSNVGQTLTAKVLGGGGGGGSGGRLIGTSSGSNGEGFTGGTTTVKVYTAANVLRSSVTAVGGAGGIYWWGNDVGQVGSSAAYGGIFAGTGGGSGGNAYSAQGGAASGNGAGGGGAGDTYNNHSGGGGQAGAYATAAWTVVSNTDYIEITVGAKGNQGYNGLSNNDIVYPKYGGHGSSGAAEIEFT